jgi:hypothetical protein
MIHTVPNKSDGCPVARDVHASFGFTPTSHVRQAASRCSLFFWVCLFCIHPLLVTRYALYSILVLPVLPVILTIPVLVVPYSTLPPDSSNPQPARPLGHRTSCVPTVALFIFHTLTPLCSLLCRFSLSSPLYLLFQCSLFHCPVIVSCRLIVACCGGIAGPWAK